MSLMSCNTLYCKNSLCTKGNKVKHELEKVEVEIKGGITRYFWVDTYRCPSCKAIFYHCKLCADNTKKQILILRSRLSRHHHLH